jgi:hypothetical protein
MYSSVLQLSVVATNYLELLHFSYCKKCEVMASSIIFLRKDAQIGRIYRQNAKRATSATRAAELL